MSQLDTLLKKRIVSGIIDKQFLIEAARHVGQYAVQLAQQAPTDTEQAVEYFTQQLKTMLGDDGEGATETAGTKISAFLVLCLYICSPWGENTHKGFHQWAREVDFEPSEAALAWSFIHEFESWEPADAETLASVIVLDRAIIRGARVGASTLNVESFIHWLKRNVETLPQGAELLKRAEQYALPCAAVNGVLLPRRGAMEELQRIARYVLREVGKRFGRTGLNSVRRQIGAPPSARRPSKTALGALYSEEVYKLAELYVELSASEREAFKAMITKLDTGETLERLWHRSSEATPPATAFTLHAANKH